MKNYRYPGTRPFEERDSHLFFGRSQDIERLYNRIFVEKMTVLHGKSGLGKTSLLQAGILPKLRQNSDYEAVTIRFRAYQEGYSVEPVQTFLDSLPEVGKDLRQTQVSDLSATTKSDRLRSDVMGLLSDDQSFWAIFKRLQIGGQKRFVLFFDQFEELFTYPDLSVRLFKSMFGELLNGTIPKKTNKTLQEAWQKGEISETEFDELTAPLDLKIVFAIRSDRMSLLDRLADKIPAILRSLYELKPLELEQAREALLVPAQLDQEKYHFATQAFDYEPDAVRKILNFLSKNNSQKIESFQLQIFCRWAEDFSDRHKDYLIETQDIGDPNLIFENYYETQIQTLPEAQQKTARELIEDELIYEKEERRLSLYEGVILDKIKDKKLLEALVNTRLLRAEPVQDGFAYEISHDTLVAPILKSKKVRVAELLRIEEERQQAEELRQAKEKAEKDRIEAQKTAKTLRTVRTLLVAAVVALILAMGAVFYAFQQTEIAKKKESEALLEKQKAEKAQALALENEKKAVEQESKTQRALTDAERQKEIAQKALADAEKQKQIAQNALVQAQTEKQRAQIALEEVRKAQSKTLELLADIGKRELDNANNELNKVRTEKAYDYLKTASSISQDEAVQEQIVLTLCEVAFIELHQNPQTKWGELKSLGYLSRKNGKIRADFSQKQGILQKVLLEAQKMPNKTAARRLVVAELEKAVGKEKIQRIRKKYYPY